MLPKKEGGGLCGIPTCSNLTTQIMGWGQIQDGLRIAIEIPKSGRIGSAIFDWI